MTIQAKLHKFKPIFHIFLFLAVFLIIAAAFRYLWTISAELSFEIVRKAIQSIPTNKIILSAIFSVLAYFVMTGYDTFGLRMAGSRLPYSKIAGVSFIGDTINANLGLSALLGSAIKLRLYTHFGEKPSIIAKAIASYTIAYWIGFLFLFTLCSISARFFSCSMPQPLPSGILIVVTIVCSAVIVLYVICCLIPTIPTVLAKVSTILPRGGNGILLLLTGIADWLLCCAAFFVLLPEASKQNFLIFISGFLFSHASGVVSQSPGGIGVFECAVLMINPEIARPNLIAALLIFRCIFYIGPFAIGTLLFAIGECVHAFRKHFATPVTANRHTSLPFVSVVIPAYNEEQTLPACLASLSSQDYKGQFEIVVVDNASTDATAAVAARYACRIVSEPWKAYNRAIKKGFDEAKGDIIACTDADTIVPADWITRITKNLLRKDVVACGGVFRFSDGAWWLKFIGAIFGRFNYHIAGANMAVWKWAYKAVGGFDLEVNLGADVKLGQRLKKVGRVVIDRSLVVATSSRRFSCAFWQTLWCYYINDIFLLIFGKPVFYLFRDYRLKPNQVARSRWAISIIASLFMLAVSACLLEAPSSGLLGPVFARGNKTMAIALTFDDGPGASTAKILDILKTYNAAATFFVIGKNVREHPLLLRRIVADGHAIGNHTHTHPYKAVIEPASNFRAELDSAEMAIVDACGLKPDLFRPPHGWRNPWMIRECHKHGYNVISWSIDSKDWCTKTPSNIAKQVFRHVRPGSVILFHDRLNTGKDIGMSQTVEALPLILDSLTRAGYSFVTIPELRMMPPDPAILSLNHQKRITGFMHTLVSKH